MKKIIQDQHSLFDIGIDNAITDLSSQKNTCTNGSAACQIPMVNILSFARTKEEIKLVKKNSDILSTIIKKANKLYW